MCRNVSSTEITIQRISKNTQNVNNRKKKKNMREKKEKSRYFMNRKFLFLYIK